MKKVFIFVLIFSYLNCYFGCTTTKNLSIIDSELDTVNNDNDLIVQTIDDTAYFFNADMYRFKNDSLDGLGSVYGQENYQRLRIALNDIVGVGEEITEAEPNWSTILWISCGVIVILAVLAVLFAQSVAASK
jgi:hypothetical protein